MSDSFEFTLHSPLTKEDWNKISDVEHENTMFVTFQTPQGRHVKYINCDVLDKIRAEIIDTLYVDSLIFGELIDFKNGKISADDVIEEFNRVSRTEVINIIDRYKAESEEEG